MSTPTRAAADLWSAIPDRAGDPNMGRIIGLAEALQDTDRRTGWPGAGRAVAIRACRPGTPE